MYNSATATAGIVIIDNIVVSITPLVANSTSALYLSLSITESMATGIAASITITVPNNVAPPTISLTRTKAIAGAIRSLSRQTR